MKIVLIRHVKSSWSNPELTDKERVIQKSRIADMRKVSEHLKRLDIIPDSIYASSSKRTRQTAKEICRNFDFNYTDVTFSDTLYECSSEDLMRLLKDEIPFSNKTIFIVGHNPAITDFANQYLNQNIENVPTSGAIAFTSNKHWNFKFSFFVKPKEL